MDDYQTYAKAERVRQAIEDERRAKKYKKGMILWGILNLSGIIIGVVGYLYYSPMHIEPDDFFGILGLFSVLSMIVQVFVVDMVHTFHFFGL